MIPHLDPGFLASWLLPYIRVQACLMTMPGWGDRLIPVRIRVGLALAVTPLMAEIAGMPHIGAGEGLFALGPAAAGEMLIGLILGLFIRFLVFALSIAASAIAAVTSLSQLVGGPSEAAPHPIGNLLDMAGIALLMALGYPIFLIDYMVESYLILPVTSLPDASMLGLAGIAMMSHIFSLAMVLASPFILGGLLYQCLLAVVSKVMPSLPVVFVGAPAALLLALTGIALFAASILGVWSDVVFDFTLPELRP